MAKNTFVPAPINADAYADIMSVIEDASNIAHPTMEDATYGQFMAIGAKYTAARQVISNAQFLDYLATQPATEDRARRILDVERRILTARQLYQEFDQIIGNMEINASAEDMVKFYQNPSAQIVEMQDSDIDDLEQEAAMLGTTVDELIAGEQLQHAKRTRQAQDRAERSAKYATNNFHALVEMLVHSAKNDHIELTDQELITYINKFSLKIGNPPSKSKTADEMGYKFKANELYKELKQKWEQVKGLNPILERERFEEMSAAKSAAYSLTQLEKHVNSLVVSISQSLDEQRRAIVNEKEGIEIY